MTAMKNMNVTKMNAYVDRCAPAIARSDPHRSSYRVTFRPFDGWAGRAFVMSILSMSRSCLSRFNYTVMAFYGAKPSD
jgi:hypothetical protein